MVHGVGVPQPLVEGDGSPTHSGQLQHLMHAPLGPPQLLTAAGPMQMDMARQFGDSLQLDPAAVGMAPQPLFAHHDVVDQSGAHPPPPPLLLDNGLAQAAAVAAANGQAPPVVVPVIINHQDAQNGFVQPALTHGLMASCLHIG